MARLWLPADLNDERLGGNNITGIAAVLSETSGKRLELLREVVPSLKRLAIFGNSGNPLVATERNATVAAAKVLGLDTIISGVQTEEDIAPSIESLKAMRRGGSPPTSPSCRSCCVSRGPLSTHLRYDLNSGHFAALRSLTSWA